MNTKVLLDMFMASEEIRKQLDGVGADYDLSVGAWYKSIKNFLNNEFSISLELTISNFNGDVSPNDIGFAQHYDITYHNGKTIIYHDAAVYHTSGHFLSSNSCKREINLLKDVVKEFVNAVDNYVSPDDAHYYQQMEHGCDMYHSRKEELAW